jgi:hypothetical protein
MKKIFFWLALLFLVAGHAAGQEDVLHVDYTKDLGPISPYVYGSNFGLGVISPDMMDMAKALNLKYMRLGGNSSEQRDLDESTVDLYVAQAKQLGAELGLSVRLLGGSPEKAAEIVRYTNIEKKYNVRYWSIGNEPNFFVAVMHAKSYTTEDLNKNWRAIAEAMLAVDPTIILVGPDISQFVPLGPDSSGQMQYEQGSDGGDPTDDLGRLWLPEFLRANGDLLGVVSIHRYPYPGLGHQANAVATIDGLRANSREWDIIIPNLRKIIRDAAGRDIPLAVTEFNSNSTPSSGGEAGLDSFYNAIWHADVLGRLIRQGVKIAAYWDVRSKTDGFGLLGINDMRPTAYVYLMYKHFGTELLASDWIDPDVSIYAAKREDGALTLMIINLGPEEKTKTLKLDGFKAAGDAEVWRFDQSHKTEQIDAQAVSDGASITVPGQSITLYIVPNAVKE